MKAPLDSLSTLANFLARHAAIIALAVFAVVGVAVLDDYGVAMDEGAQRNNGVASFDYILGDEDALIEKGIDKYFGVAFELPLIAVERLLRLEDSRDIYLSRHIITHMFFLVGGFFAYLLSYRLFGSRLVALLAMLIFLLHPRLYAHSFFNSKDVPFLSMFMIALYLIHRAFRRDTVWAFALCGVGVGLLVNIRIMGVTLIPAVLGMLALDAFHAVKRGIGVKRALVNICAFSTICAATLYAAWPALWRDPLGATEALGLLYRHPFRNLTLFRGEIVRWPNIPWDYIPTWILITTPPVALLLAVVGIAYIARLCAADWRGALANSTARFGLLAAACLILPAAAVIALNSNIFNGWRHVYFLYAPMCVLAAFGLRRLAALPKTGVRAAALALTAVGIAAVVVQMVRVHPHQNEYFNFLVNKSGIADRWEMNYWRVPYREALETLLEMRPGGRVAIAAPSIGERWFMEYNIEIMQPDDRRRLDVNPDFPSFRAVPGDGGDGAVWTREVYGAPIVSIVDARAETEAAFQDIYAAARASEPAASGGGFDLYADNGRIIYVKDGCGEEDARSRFPLFAFPVEQSDLPGPMRDAGYEYAPLDDSDFFRYGAIYDGNCVIVRDLPREYPISYVETGQFTPGESRAWSAVIPLDRYRERYERALSSLSGEPAARSGFDIWLDGRELTYVKENCDEADTRGRFYLSVFPADRSDLPQSARDAGREHESLNFDFDRYGAILDGRCVIIRYLPDYAISRIETGQWLPGEGELWSAGVVVGD